MDEYYAKYASNNAANGASDTDFESPEPDTTSSNNVVKFLEEQQDLNTLNEDDFRTVSQIHNKNRRCPLCNHIYKSQEDYLAHSAMHYIVGGTEGAGEQSPTPQISANKLTLFKSGGADYAHNTTARLTGFSDLPTALRPLSRASATSSGTSLPNSPNSVDIGGPTQIQIHNDFHQNSRPPPPPYGSHLPSPTPSSAGSGYLLSMPSGAEVPSPAGSGYLLGMPSGSEVHSPAGSGYLLGMPSGSEVPSRAISNPTVNYWGYQHQNSFYNYPTSTHSVATGYEMPMAYQGFVCQRCGMTFGNSFSDENYDLLVKHCQYNCLANTFQYPPISAHPTSPPTSHHQDQTLAEASKTVKCKSNCDCNGQAHKTNTKTGRPLQTRKRKQVAEKENIDSETLAKYKTLEWEERTGYWCQKCSIKFPSSELLIEHMSKKDVHTK